jgi:hypothetical protein
MIQDIGNGAMNALRCWKLRYVNTLSALQRDWETSVQLLKKPTNFRAAYPYSVMNILAALAICFQIAVRGGRCSFQGLSEDAGRADFSKNLLGSLFNDDLSNEPILSRIHLVGQHL